MNTFYYGLQWRIEEFSEAGDEPTGRGNESLPVGQTSRESGPPDPELLPDMDVGLGVNATAHYYYYYSSLLRQYGQHTYHTI